MRKMFFLSTILFFTLGSAFAQIEATTNDGKKVILNEEGTWKYVESSVKDSKPINNSDCDSFISTEVDKVTGKSSVAAKEMLIVSKDNGKKGFGFYILKSGRGSIIFSIQAIGAGNCIDDDNKMNVLFRDGTRVELRNDGKFNCEAKYTQYFGGAFGKKKELEMFSTKEVETVRIWTSRSYVEEDFTQIQSKQLIQTVNCLISD